MSYEEEGYIVIASDGEIDLITPENEYDGRFDIALCNTHEIIGYITYGDNNEVLYKGNVGYFINEDKRGNKYALKALNLLKRFLKEEGEKKIVLAISPDNMASRKTAINAGPSLILYRPVPINSTMYNYAPDNVLVIYQYDLNEEKRHI